MMTAVSGTPGTGKSSAGAELARRGHIVQSQRETVDPFVIGRDETDGSLIIDEEAWAASFTPFDGIIEGHMTHLLPTDRVVVLRCRPDILESRLSQRTYPREKVRENCDAEALDVILIETLEHHAPGDVLEIDTTERDISYIADLIENFMRGEVAAAHGAIDWSHFLVEHP